jgi:hypothetical protein
VRNGGHTLVTRLPARNSIALGERLAVAVDPERIHLFHEGRRIN